MVKGKLLSWGSPDRTGAVPRCRRLEGRTAAGREDDPSSYSGTSGARASRAARAADRLLPDDTFAQSCRCSVDSACQQRNTLYERSGICCTRKSGGSVAWAVLSLGVLTAFLLLAVLGAMREVVLVRGELEAFGQLVKRPPPPSYVEAALPASLVGVLEETRASAGDDAG